MKVTLTYCNNEAKVSKNGKPYTSCSIKTAEHGDVFINGFGNATTKLWAAGEVVDVDVYDEEYNGKVYKKFKAMEKADVLEERVIELERKVQAMSDFLRRQTQAVVAPTVTPAKPPHVVPKQPSSTVATPGVVADPRFVLTPEEEKTPWEADEPTLDDLEF